MSRPLPDPAQRRAADPGASVFVVANAGSGKTSTLVDRVARLLLRGTKPAEVLCVTYTKAAAAEMQSRLYARLGQWAIQGDQALRQELAALDGSDAARLTPEVLSRARRLFARALETPGGLKIQTLHAFCEQLLRRFPVEAGIDPGFEVLDDVASAELSKVARDDLARHALADPDGTVGRAYAHFAVTLDWESFQGLLGRIETDRAVLTTWLGRIAAGESPGPREAVGAPDGTLEAHQAAFLGRLDRGRWLSLADEMARGSKTDGDCAARMRTADWSFDGLRPVFLTKDGPRARMATAQAPSGARSQLEALQTAFLAGLDEARKLRTAEETEHVLALAGVHAAFYDAAKRASGALDFADLIAGAVDLLTDRADAAWVLFKLDGGIDHILLDEAQDTAPEQWEILEALTEGFFAGAGSERETAGPRTVFAVGDEKQSIYSFQGARPERLRREAQRYDLLAQGAGLAFAGVELATSFRSTPQVLEFVDAVFAGPERAAALVGPDAAAAPHHVPARIGQPGAVDLWPLHEEDAAPDREAWDAPVDAEARDGARKRLARDLAADIKRQVAQGVAVHDKAGRPRPCGWGDFLILVRRRDATFEEILRGLKAAGVPVAGADRLKLSEHVAFHDLRALARFALFPHDDLTVAEILRGPFCDVGETSLFDLAGATATRPGLWRHLRARAHERVEWGHALDLLTTARDLAARDAFGFFSGLLNRPDAQGRTGRVRMLTRLGAEAAEAIDETLNLVLAGEGRGAVDLETALARMETAEVEVKRELEGPRGQVRVMTVHGAKGLEAPVVILPDTTGVPGGGRGAPLLPLELADGTMGRILCAASKGEDCPTAAEARAERDRRAQAETLRLLYVALTRARDRIVVMGRVAAGRKPAAGSWREVVAETFGRLDGVRDLEDGVRRFGVDPAVFGPAGSRQTPIAPALPDWTRRTPPADRTARPASPSRRDGSIRPPAPSPLATAAGPGAPLGRFRRGDLIHRLLERLPEVAPDARLETARRLLARETDLDEARRAEMIAAALGVLDDARFAEVFGPGSRAEVAVAAKVGTLTVSGRIDRLAITPDRVLVIDFKTNRPAPDRVEDADPAYVVQMALYVAALARLYPDRMVEAALVWTDGPKLMPVPKAMLEAALP